LTRRNCKVIITNISGLEQNSSDRPDGKVIPSLSIIRILGYNILRNLDDDLVRDKEFPCSECTSKILALPSRRSPCSLADTYFIGFASRRSF